MKANKDSSSDNNNSNARQPTITLGALTMLPTSLLAQNNLIGLRASPRKCSAVAFRLILTASFRSVGATEVFVSV